MSEPYDLIASAIGSWRAGDSARAEADFREGIDAYRRRDPSGLDFALGRYGAFLLKEGRVDEAFAILDEAVARGTDIPAIWDDYLGILAKRGDAADMLAAMQRMKPPLDPTSAEWLLPHVRRAIRSHDFEFAEELSRLVRDDARRRKSWDDAWAATGEHGHALEMLGRLDDAIDEWATAFAAGSNDALTANRLSMHLQRAKKNDEAAAIIRDALQRGLPARVEETLRLRLAKIEQPDGTSAKERAVQAFSVRSGDDTVRLVSQHRLKPPVRSLAVLGDAAYCLGVTKDSAVLTQIDLATGAETTRVDGLPRFELFEVSPHGWGIGVHRTGRVGFGTTSLFFLEPGCSVYGTAELPDAVSKLAFGANQWFVGCRDGRLYSFDLGGVLRWQWVTPGADDYDGDPYFRPCPFHVAASDEVVVVASMGDLFAIRFDGTFLWHREVPSRGPQTTTVSVGGSPSLDQARKVLGVSAGAGADELKSAYRRLALATHPDRNPEDPEAAAMFREVQSAYETLLSGDASDASGFTIELTMSMQTMVHALSVANSSVFVGSTDGIIGELDMNGTVTMSRVVGRYNAIPVLAPDGTLAAAISDNVVSFFSGPSIVNAVEIEKYTQAAKWWNGELVLADGETLRVLDRLGRTVWAAEFPKRISGFATGRLLACAAGAFMVFERQATNG